MLLSAASVVVVLAGLQAAGDILLPILFSVFLSILALPLVRFLQRAGLPTPVAIVVTVLAVGVVLLAVTGIIAGTVRSFTAQVPKYEAPLQELVTTSISQLESFGLEVDLEDATSLLAPGDIMSLVGQTVNALVAVLSRIVMVTLTMTFILFEASDLAMKTEVAFGAEAVIGGPFAKAPEDVQRYLFIKTMVSLATGVLAGVWCTVLGLDFPVMWGLIAFVFNYVPSIGSIIAAIPPILLGIVQLGWLGAFGIALGYIAINVALGNLLEPRLLGRSLGLSPLVVFLSLLFWGWLWGPAGMLLCVPMTVIAKLILETNDDTRWIAVFLGSAREAAAEEPRHHDTSASISSSGTRAPGSGPSA